MVATAVGRYAASAAPRLRRWPGAEAPTRRLRGTTPKVPGHEGKAAPTPPTGVVGASPKRHASVRSTVEYDPQRSYFDCVLGVTRVYALTLYISTSRRVQKTRRGVQTRTYATAATLATGPRGARLRVLPSPGAMGQLLLPPAVRGPRGPSESPDWTPCGGASYTPPGRALAGGWSPTGRPSGRGQWTGGRGLPIYHQRGCYNDCYMYILSTPF